MLSSQYRCFIASPEIYDVLYKMLKTDDEQGTGDVQLLCRLFTGEKSCYNYSTEGPRDIAADSAFSMFGATQMLNMARLLVRLDCGHGLLDRMLIFVPQVLRPLPDEQADAVTYMNQQRMTNFFQLYDTLLNMHS